MAAGVIPRALAAPDQDAAVGAGRGLADPNIDVVVVECGLAGGGDSAWISG